MRDQAVQRQRALVHQRCHRLQVLLLPLRGHADLRFAHEGRCEGKAQVLFVEAREHHLTARRQPPDQAVEQRAVTAHVADGAVILATVFVRVQHRIAHRTRAPRRLRFPDGRRGHAQRQRDARQQPAHDTVADDELRRHHRLPRAAQRHRVVAGGGQRQQHRLRAEFGLHLHDAVPLHDEARASAAEDVAHALETVGTGDEDVVADLAVGGTGCLASTHHPAHGFIARHQRVAQARKRRHRAVPQEPFGAGADAAEADFHLHVSGLERLQFQAAHGQLPGRFKDDGLGVFLTVCHGPMQPGIEDAWTFYPAASSTRSNSCPYASSFFDPTPLMPARASSEAGHSRAISASVASWKTT